MKNLTISSIESNKKNTHICNYGKNKRTYKDINYPFIYATIRHNLN